MCVCVRDFFAPLQIDTFQRQTFSVASKIYANTIIFLFFRSFLDAFAFVDLVRSMLKFFKPFFPSHIAVAYCMIFDADHPFALGSRRILIISLSTFYYRRRIFSRYFYDQYFFIRNNCIPFQMFQKVFKLNLTFDSLSMTVFHIIQSVPPSTHVLYSRKIRRRYYLTLQPVSPFVSPVLCNLNCFFWRQHADIEKCLINFHSLCWTKSTHYKNNRVWPSLNGLIMRFK